MATTTAKTIYNSRAWKLCRDEAIARAGCRCQRCGRFYGLQVHHKRELSQGGEPFDLDNLRVLCFRCHVKEHHPRAKMVDDKTKRKLAQWRRFVRVATWLP